LHQVTSLSYIQAEFCEAHVEEADPFDEAFDQLAKESLSKTQLEEIEKDLFDEDLFDTTKADDVLRLASLTHQLNRGYMHNPFFWRRNPTKTLGFLRTWISPWFFVGFLLISPP
jgi:hypothetical protein